MSFDAVLWPIKANKINVKTAMQTQADSLSKTQKKSKPRRYTMLDGHDIFVKHCMSCHLADNNSSRNWQINAILGVKAGVDFLVNATIMGPEINDELRQRRLMQVVIVIVWMHSRQWQH